MKPADIRPSRPEDLPLIERLYPRAFPDEDLLPLVRQLLGSEPGILSLVAEAGPDLVGNIIFTPGTVSGSKTRAALLAPLAVDPDWQRQGIGTALIREGLARLEAAGINQVYVLGDPAYYARSGYARSGFKPERGVSPPYPLPDEYRDAWQSLSLGPTPLPVHGELALPQIWMQPKLWGP